MDQILTPEHFGYIAGLLGVVSYLQRQITRQERQIEKLNAQVTALNGIAVAVKACPIEGCTLRSLTPAEVFQPPIHAHE